jgi:peptidyl-prolyl cis-trans isomerase A (cyclophilin A)
MTRFLLLALSLVASACSGPRVPDTTPALPAALREPDPVALAAAAPDSFVVTIETSAGEFDVRVRRDWAPLGADRFHWLSQNQFFAGGRFFRVVPGFVVQFGLTGIPALDELWLDRSLRDEPARESNRRGTVVFATGGPNSRSTQLFINLVDNGQLDMMGFAPFGEVVRGMEVVDRLYSGYGEGAPMGNGPDQGRIFNEGNAYLTAQFPALDSIVRTRVTR